MRSLFTLQRYKELVFLLFSFVFVVYKLEDDVSCRYNNRTQLASHTHTHYTPRHTWCWQSYTQGPKLTSLWSNRTEGAEIVKKRESFLYIYIYIYIYISSSLYIYIGYLPLLPPSWMFLMGSVVQLNNEEVEEEEAAQFQEEIRSPKRIIWRPRW